MTARPNGAVNIAGVHAPGSSAFEGKRDACGAYRKEYRLAAVWGIAAAASFSVFLLWFSQQTEEPVSAETGSSVVVILEHIRQDIRNISHILLMPQRI